MMKQEYIEIQQHEQDFAYVKLKLSGFVQSQTAQIEAHSFVQSGIAQMPTTAIPPILCLITYTHHLEILNND